MENKQIKLPDETPADMPEKKISDFEISAEQVQKAVSSFRYQIMKKCELLKQLGAKDIIAIEVETAPEGDFITGDIASFMEYVGLNGINTVMYRFGFYTPDGVDSFYKLKKEDRDFFSKMHEHNDLAEYQRFAAYVPTLFDLEHPNHISLYALHGHAVIACDVDDMWLERLPLPSAQEIRKICIDSRAPGEVNFRFYDSKPAPVESKSAPAEKKITAETEAPATQPVQEETAAKSKKSKKSRKRRNKGK